MCDSIVVVRWGRKKKAGAAQLPPQRSHDVECLRRTIGQSQHQHSWASPNLKLTAVAFIILGGTAPLFFKTDMRYGKRHMLCIQDYEMCGIPGIRCSTSQPTGMYCNRQASIVSSIFPLSIATLLMLQYLQE